MNAALNEREQQTYARLCKEAIPIANLIAGMATEWGWHGPSFAALLGADVVVGIDVAAATGGIMYGHDRVNDPEADVVVFAFDATREVPGTGGGTELDFITVAVLAVKALGINMARRN